MRESSLLDLDALQEFLSSIESDTPDLIFGAGEESVYHYTDLAGLRGVVTNHDLWLTHSRYSNDDEEVTHGYGVAKRVIKAQLDAAPDPSERRDYLKSLNEQIETPTPEDVYICCFCLDDDLLSQWRGYGANGTGVSLRFDPKKFDYLTGPGSPAGGLMRLWKIFYDGNQQERIVLKAIDFAFQRQEPIDVRVRKAAEAIRFFIPTFKNENFQEERECRLIFTPSVGRPVTPQFRVARAMLVPYLSVRELSGEPPTRMGREPLHKLPIIGARVGPSPQKMLNVDSVRMLLVQNGYPDAVDCSGTPFRG